MNAVTVKLPKELNAKLTILARKRRTSKSALLREAFEVFARNPTRSVTEAAGDLVGSLNGPPDLSTNPKYMEGFGR